MKRLRKIGGRFKNCRHVPLHGHDEKSFSVNKGVFLELVEYSRKIDSVLHKHLSDSRVKENDYKMNC